MSQLDRELRPYEVWKADMQAIHDRLPHDPFRGLRVAYNTSNEALKHADVARGWWRTVLRNFEPDVANYIDARRYLKGILDRIGLAQEHGDLTHKAAEILPGAKEQVEAVLAAMDAADAKRDAANTAERDLKKENFPRQHGRYGRLESQARITGLAADFFAYFGYEEFEPKWGTPLQSLAHGLRICADAADLHRPAAVGETLRQAAAAAEAGSIRKTWMALIEAEEAMELGQVEDENSNEE